MNRAYLSSATRITRRLRVCRRCLSSPSSSRMKMMSASSTSISSAYASRAAGASDENVRATYNAAGAAAAGAAALVAAGAAALGFGGAVDNRGSGSRNINENSLVMPSALGSAFSPSSYFSFSTASGVPAPYAAAMCECKSDVPFQSVGYNFKHEPPIEVEAGYDGGDEENDENKTTSFQTISHTQIEKELRARDEESTKDLLLREEGKSARAFRVAMEHELFNCFYDVEDGVTEEEEDENESLQRRQGNETYQDVASSNAVTESFVSFAPMSDSSTVMEPRIKITTRRTHRRSGVSNKADEQPYCHDPLQEQQQQQQEGTYPSTHPQQQPPLQEEDELLATSLNDLPSKGGYTFPRTNQEKIQSQTKVPQRIHTVRSNALGQNQVYTKQMYFYQSSSVRDTVKSKFRLFALPSSERLGKEMAFLLGTELNCIDVGAFTDGETSVKIQDHVRGKNVFVVCTTTSTNAIMELLLTISALRRGSAKRICAVIPYYGYSRQDRRTGMKREPIAAADMAKLLEEMGVDSVICMDLHNPLLKGFFSPRCPVDHIVPGPVAAAYFYEELFLGGHEGDVKEEEADEKKEEKNEGSYEGENKTGKAKEEPKITVVAAHENQVYRANGFRNALQKLSGRQDIGVAFISNTRALKVHTMSNTPALVGDVAGRKCIIVDDIINTGGTMRSAVNMLNEAGAESIYAWATHGVIQNPEIDTPQKIQDMPELEYLLISNSVAIDRELPPKIRSLSVAPLLAEAVARALHNESISRMMDVSEGKKRVVASNK
mmetsp:Transcript_26286/g.52346  ORF Transcript_26286/g.52346 Transcript_26286/m.52346 type:complete len:777 (+) Transcript_26286:185-2515(+)